MSQAQRNPNQPPPPPANMPPMNGGPDQGFNPGQSLQQDPSLTGPAGPRPAPAPMGMQPPQQQNHPLIQRLQNSPQISPSSPLSQMPAPPSNSGLPTFTAAEIWKAISNDPRSSKMSPAAKVQAFQNLMQTVGPNAKMQMENQKMQNQWYEKMLNMNNQKEMNTDRIQGAWDRINTSIDSRFRLQAEGEKFKAKMATLGGKASPQQQMQARTLQLEYSKAEARVNTMRNNFAPEEDIQAAEAEAKDAKSNLDSFMNQLAGPASGEKKPAARGGARPATAKPVKPNIAPSGDMQEDVTNQVNGGEDDPLGLLK
jgi:hypothetical protein